MLIDRTPKIGEWIGTCGPRDCGVGKVTEVNLETKEVTATFLPKYDPQQKGGQKTVNMSVIGDIIENQEMIVECENDLEQFPSI
jgi:hypothetical protein